MICILKLVDGEIKGWVIALSIEKAAQEAEMAFESDLAKELREIKSSYHPGKYILKCGYYMLVSQ